MIDPKTAATIAEAAGKIAPRTVDQVDRFGADVVKTARLLLAPFQLAAAWQDRLESYVDKSIRQVPEDRRIEPVESVAYPIVEKLRFQTETDPITELYINLLSRAMDGERVGEAHPAFFSFISQMAPDELIFLQELSKRDQTIILAPVGEKAYPEPVSRLRQIERYQLPTSVIDEFSALVFSYEDLNQPDMFPVYQEHLQHLGLIEYKNSLQRFRNHINGMQREQGELSMFTIQLTHLGRLFLKACTNPDQPFRAL